jgi:hypothetical protein
MEQYARQGKGPPLAPCAGRVPTGNIHSRRRGPEATNVVFVVKTIVVKVVVIVTATSVPAVSVVPYRVLIVFWLCFDRVLIVFSL